MENPDWDLAMGAATAGNPQCTPYAEHLKTVVSDYGGGAGAPLIREQDEFAKTMGENRRLGEEFTKAVATAVFHATEEMIDLRHCLITTNLASNKIVDGIYFLFL